MFKSGDKYVHFTKYGGVNKGEVVKTYSTHTVVDLNNKIRYKRHFIENTKGNSICINEEEVYLIEKEYTDEQGEIIIENMKSLINKITK